jgi:hypothetical protein
MTVDGDPLVDTIHFVAEGVSNSRHGEPAPVPKSPSTAVLKRKEGPLIKVSKGIISAQRDLALRCGMSAGLMPLVLSL